MKIIIIGKGPAGISASLYTKRANIDTTIIGKNIGALEKADKIENYFGFSEPIDAKALVNNGIKNAKRLGATIIDDEVTSIEFNGEYTVTTANGDKYEANAIILATGAGRNTPKLDGIEKFATSGISYCAVCDAFFYRKKDVMVLGTSSYALHEAQTLLPIASSVTILTDGNPLEVDIPNDINVKTEKITRLIGNEKLEGVEFNNGDILNTSGLFIALGVASSTDLARKLGAEIIDNRIAVKNNMETNIPGLFAAGDCIGGLLQISKAVSDGAIAGTSAIKFLRKK